MHGSERGKSPAVSESHSPLRHSSLLPVPFPCAQITLETEVTNSAALRLYETLGFIRDKRLPKYYLNGNDAFRLKCWLR